MLNKNDILVHWLVIIVITSYHKYIIHNIISILQVKKREEGGATTARLANKWERNILR
jgi:hypothetical protein